MEIVTRAILKPGTRWPTSRALVASAHAHVRNSRPAISAVRRLPWSGFSFRKILGAKVGQEDGGSATSSERGNIKTATPLSQLASARSSPPTLFKVVLTARTPPAPASDENLRAWLHPNTSANALPVFGCNRATLSPSAVAHVLQEGDVVQVLPHGLNLADADLLEDQARKYSPKGSIAEFEMHRWKRELEAWWEAVRLRSSRDNVPGTGSGSCLGESSEAGGAHMTNQDAARRGASSSVGTQRETDSGTGEIVCDLASASTSSTSSRPTMVPVRVSPANMEVLEVPRAVGGMAPRLEFFEGLMKAEDFCFSRTSSSSSSRPDGESLQLRPTALQMNDKVFVRFPSPPHHILYQTLLDWVEAKLWKFIHNSSGEAGVEKLEVGATSSSTERLRHKNFDLFAPSIGQQSASHPSSDGNNRRFSSWVAFRRWFDDQLAEYYDGVVAGPGRMSATSTGGTSSYILQRSPGDVPERMEFRENATLTAANRKARHKLFGRLGLFASTVLSLLYYASNRRSRDRAARRSSQEAEVLVADEAVAGGGDSLGSSDVKSRSEEQEDAAPAPNPLNVFDENFPSMLRPPIHVDPFHLLSEKELHNSYNWRNALVPAAGFCVLNGMVVYPFATYGTWFFAMPPVTAGFVTAALGLVLWHDLFYA